MVTTVASAFVLSRSDTAEAAFSSFRRRFRFRDRDVDDLLFRGLRRA
jgi:hypothetical protein